MLTLLAHAISAAAAASGKESLFAYLIAGYAFAMLLNVIVPHTAATLLTRRYMPGFATGLLLNLPVTLALLDHAIQSGHVDAARMLWVGPLTAVILLLSLPLLFALGRRLFPDETG